MSKVIPTSISKTEREKLKRRLCTKIAKLKSQQEVNSFLEDLLTDSEFVMIIRRLQIAKMLLDGCFYFQIKLALNVSYNTIKNVRDNLDKVRGGYTNFIKDLKL